MQSDLYHQLTLACVDANVHVPPTPSHLAFLLREWIATKRRYEEVKCTMVRLAEEGSITGTGSYLAVLDELYCRACIQVDVGRRCNAVRRA
jgi:hypothetical protein